MTNAIDQQTNWAAPVTLTGSYVRLEPTTAAHAAGLLAIADAEVFQNLSSHPPRSMEDAEQMVQTMSTSSGRMCWTQIDVRQGSGGPVAGTTSFYEINPGTRSVAIGYTWLGREWWRTGLNTEAKLLLLRRAFEDLGAVRVFWQTDIRNTRSQEAIARLGAEHEGVLRKHKRRPDGSWRDTVQFAMTDDDWPAVHERLAKRLYS